MHLAAESVYVSTRGDRPLARRPMLVRRPHLGYIATSLDKSSRPTDLRAQLQSALATSYTLERELGRGGMATVFLGQDLRHDRPVALKVLHPDLARTLGRPCRGASFRSPAFFI